MNYKGTKDKKFICQGCKSEFGFKGYSTNHKFCSSECYYAHHAKAKEELFDLRYQSWLDGLDLGLVNSRPLIRQFVTKRDGYNCKICGISEWNGKPIVLWTDHIDGDASNNSPDNFRLVCPNCDSQSETFGGKNRGSGRKARGLRQYG